VESHRQCIQSLAVQTRGIFLSYLAESSLTSPLGPECGYVFQLVYRRTLVPQFLMGNEHTKIQTSEPGASERTDRSALHTLRAIWKTVFSRVSEQERLRRRRAELPRQKKDKTSSGFPTSNFLPVWCARLPRNHSPDYSHSSSSHTTIALTRAVFVSEVHLYPSQQSKKVLVYAKAAK